MVETFAGRPRVVHSLPGRARVHVPGLSGANARVLERGLCELRGVRSARASTRTQNVLVHFDRAETKESTIVSSLHGLAERALRHEERAPGQGRAAGLPARRARIAVRGLDRDPELAHRVVEKLRSRRDVTLASANVLTGRVLVELTEDADVERLLEQLAELEPPQIEDGEATPSHPLDPAPLVQASTRLIGAALGIGFLAARRVQGTQGAPVERTGPAEIAGTLGILEGLPAATERLDDAIGHDSRELVFGALGAVSLTFSGSLMGLALAAATGLRLLTEAQPKRAAWQEYERRLGDHPIPQAGDTWRVEAGERLPLRAEVLEGHGTALGYDGLPEPAVPGRLVEPGSRIYGGPLTVRLREGRAFEAAERSPPRPLVLERYLGVIGPVALGYAALTAVLTRSPSRAFTALLLVNPRPAIEGAEAADHGASARAMRSGVTDVGSRAGRPVRLPDVLLLDSPRVLTDRLELSSVTPIEAGLDSSDVLRQAAAVSGAAGSPWGPVFRASGGTLPAEGRFDGSTATATLNGEELVLGPPDSSGPSIEPRPQKGEQGLVLRRGARAEPIGVILLRPRLAAGATKLPVICRRHGVRLELLSRTESPSARSITARAGVGLETSEPLDERVRSYQREGAIVAVVSDSSEAAEAFAGCDLAIGLTSGRSGHFHARADILAPGLDSVAAVITAGARHDWAVRDAVGLSIVANAAGAVWGLRGAPTFNRGSRATHLGALAATAASWARLRGGRRAASVAERLSNPQPERWGRQDPETVLRHFESSERGLSNREAAKRRRRAPIETNGHTVTGAVLEQLRSPLVTVLAVGAGFSFALRAFADVGMIASVIVANATVGALQTRQAGRAAEALERLGAQRATVRRDGGETAVPVEQVVPGDVLVLAPGDRIAADARLLQADWLEIDEAALTGESMPVPKSVDNGTDESRVLLAGTDVTVGTARAVVVAVGEDTRMGAVSAALANNTAKQSLLDARLGEIMRTGFPVILAGGMVVTASGLVRARPLLPQLALGASIAIAAVPEGLPLLAGVAEAGVAQRLARRRALVRRLSSVEALGRVDVACTDKTGTLTEGRLAVTRVVDTAGRSESPPRLSPPFRDILLTAAFATPHPDAPDASSHPTDVAVREAAERVGIEGRIRTERQSEWPFDPGRSFHATLAGGRLRVKGAVEVIAQRCVLVRRNGSEHDLDDEGRRELLDRAQSLAEEGLRVLMVAEGGNETSGEDPRDLTAVGFLAISDPIRPSVRAAVHRCQAAGVRVIMLTGDHPATARAIAREAGLPAGDKALLTGPEVIGLDDPKLDERLEHTNVVARITPLDKVRIVEALQRRGHVVAMTGDGVNDAPALRLADVGVAIGSGGTEVARQAAEVVLADNDFSTLVEALVEGRGFWQNIRRALGLLLGGNLGELGLMVTAGAVGLPPPMTTRQILSVNLVTDVLPAVAVAVQQPEHRDLSKLAREGAAGLDKPLRDDIVRRGIATAVPSLAAYVAAARRAEPARAQGVAFASIVATQLGQTLDLGRAEGRLTGSVGGAVAGSAALVAASLTVPPLQRFLGLATPTPGGLLLVAGATAASVYMGRALPIGEAA